MIITQKEIDDIQKQYEDTLFECAYCHQKSLDIKEKNIIQKTHDNVVYDVVYICDNCIDNFLREGV